MTKRMLFVDDEPAVLESLKLSLHKCRGHWDMVYCVGAEAALAAVRKEPFDIVVSDLRMPGMDGASLLEQISELTPRTVRIVLSGHGDKAAMARALLVSHQILAKPCHSDELRRVLERACQLHSLLNHPRLCEVANGARQLPTLPRACSQLSAALAGGASVRVVANVIEQDPAMAATILHYANSPYFGMSKRVADITQAVLCLGVEMVRTLTLTAKMFEELQPHARFAEYADRLVEHSSKTARLARILLPAAGQDCFTAGLLHAVGELLMMSREPDGFDKVKDLRGDARVHAEREVFGATLGELGGYLLNLWGLPLVIVSAIASYQDPPLAASPELNVPAALHIAERLCAGIAPNAALLAALGLDDRVKDWQAQVEIGEPA